jgi:hypothetical protein
MKVDAREIRAMLQARVGELLGKLFPQHTITFPVFAPLNPTRPDRTPGSFVIWTSGAAAGGFNEYSPAGPPASGDVIDLIAYVRRADRKYAFGFAREFLGLGKMTDAELARERTAARQAASAAVQQQSEKIAARIRRANEIWRKTVPIAGSVAETYLASRRVPLVLLKNPDTDLRFIPRLEWWKGARFDGKEKVEDGPHLPAMVAAMRNAGGDLVAVHCTFLRVDGSGKADVSEPKLMRGSAKGAMIRLARGPSNLTIEEARESGVIEPLIVSEGIENGLTAALACPEARAAAAGSFDLMLLAPVDADCFEPIIYAVDNDDNERAAAAIADHIDALAAAGKRATFMRSHAGKDLNDLIRT